MPFRYVLKRSKLCSIDLFLIKCSLTHSTNNVGYFSIVKYMHFQKLICVII